MTHLVLKIRIMASWIQTSSIVSHDHQIISLLTDALKGQTRGRYVQSDKVEFARVLLSISLSLPFSLSLSLSRSLSLSLSLSLTLFPSLSRCLSLSLLHSLSFSLSLSLSRSHPLSLSHSLSLSISLSLSLPPRSRSQIVRRRHIGQRHRFSHIRIVQPEPGAQYNLPLIVAVCLFPK